MRVKKRRNKAVLKSKVQISGYLYFKYCFSMNTLNGLKNGGPEEVVCVSPGHSHIFHTFLSARFHLEDSQVKIKRSKSRLHLNDNWFHFELSLTIPIQNKIAALKSLLSGRLKLLCALALLNRQSTWTLPKTASTSPGSSKITLVVNLTWFEKYLLNAQSHKGEKNVLATHRMGRNS